MPHIDVFVFVLTNQPKSGLLLAVNTYFIKGQSVEKEDNDNCNHGYLSIRGCQDLKMTSAKRESF